jgi:hypothetical protein
VGVSPPGYPAVPAPQRKKSSAFRETATDATGWSQVLPGKMIMPQQPSSRGRADVPALQFLPKEVKPYAVHTYLY